MPELPDVEGFRRYFDRHAAGRRVERVQVIDRTMLRNSSPQAVGRALRDRRLEKPARRGKWLVAPAGGPVLLLHFGMTGLLAEVNRENGPHRHDRLLLHLDDGTLAYRNMRKFGGVWLARDADQAEEVLGPLGTDAGRISRDDFTELVTRRRGGIKALLMDQKALAGVGNLLSDEVLWRARIHPSSPTTSLTPRKADDLYDALRETIRESDRHGRIPAEPAWLTGVRDERGDCPRCGTRVRKGTIAGRTACWCPRCQRRRR
jgi:formamidopyrimidine-DNA glycosylase